MEHQGRLYLFWAVLVIVIIIIVWQFEKYRKINIEKINVAYTEYQNALKNKDKVQALALGRKYYGLLRHNNRLTIYDEQAITNDLNSIS